MLSGPPNPLLSSLTPIPPKTYAKPASTPVSTSAAQQSQLISIQVISKVSSQTQCYHLRTFITQLF